MKHIKGNYYVHNGYLYVIKKLKPTPFGYRITEPDGTRKYVSTERIKELENGNTNNIQNQK